MASEGPQGDGVEREPLRGLWVDDDATFLLRIEDAARKRADVQIECYRPPFGVDHLIRCCEHDFVALDLWWDSELGPWVNDKTAGVTLLRQIVSCFGERAVVPIVVVSNVPEVVAGEVDVATVPIRVLPKPGPDQSVTRLLDEVVEEVRATPRMEGAKRRRVFKWHRVCAAGQPEDLVEIPDPAGGIVAEYNCPEPRAWRERVGGRISAVQAVAMRDAHSFTKGQDVEAGELSAVLEGLARIGHGLSSHHATVGYYLRAAVEELARSRRPVTDAQIRACCVASEMLERPAVSDNDWSRLERMLLAFREPNEVWRGEVVGVSSDGVSVAVEDRGGRVTTFPPDEVAPSPVWQGARVAVEVHSFAGRQVALLDVLEPNLVSREGSSDE